MSKPRRWLVAIAGAVVAASLAVPPSAVAQADEPIQDPLPDPVPSSLGLTVAEFAQGDGPARPDEIEDALATFGGEHEHDPNPKMTEI